jgi:hypothetical protein
VTTSRLIDEQSANVAELCAMIDGGAAQAPFMSEAGPGARDTHRETGLLA